MLMDLTEGSVSKLAIVPAIFNHVIILWQPTKNYINFTLNKSKNVFILSSIEEHEDRFPIILNFQLMYTA